MNRKQERWRATLTSRLASAKLKRAALIGLLDSGIPLEVIKTWAKIGATGTQQSSTSVQRSFSN